MEIPNEYKKNLYKVSLAFIIILCAYFGIKFLSEFRNYGTAGSIGVNTISVTGHGEVFAAPDIASVYINMESAKNTEQQAADEVNKKTTAVVDFLKSSGVAEKDIKTEGYNSYPRYSNPQVCPMYYPADERIMPPCTPTESKITGYTVSQNLSVKIRAVDDASKIIDGIHKIGVTSLSGPNLSIDDEDALKEEARRLAIQEAKMKAKKLSRDLGVRLGRVASFSEGGYYPTMGYAKAEMAMDMVSNPAPAVIPKGENIITSDVTITYEIR